MERMKKMRENKGITLIALVITIIVLLILAGVTINLTLGENGIFTIAQKAAKNYTNAQNKELADLVEFENTINGTVNGTKYISTKEELKKLAEEVNSGKDLYGEIIVLQKDIDLGEGENWTPIGNKDYPFAGTFDGAKHKITNLKIEDNEEEYQGLFGNNTGTIMNIGIESGSITKGLNIGAVCGYSTGLIENCYNKMDISCEGGIHIGGIVGQISGNAIVRNCYNTGTLSVTNARSWNRYCKVSKNWWYCW